MNHFEKVTKMFFVHKGTSFKIVDYCLSKMSCFDNEAKKVFYIERY